VRRSDFTYAAIANPSFSSLISEGLARFIIQMHLQMMQMQMHMQMQMQMQKAVLRFLDLDDSAQAARGIAAPWRTRRAPAEYG
jgi:hypothetical protein